MFEVVGLCLPGGLLVFLLLAHQWWSAGVAFLLLVGLIIRYLRDWSRTAITIQFDQIVVHSPYGFRRTIAVEEVDGMLRAGSNVYFLDRTGARLGAFPAGVFTLSQIESLAAELGIEIPA